MIGYNGFDGYDMPKHVLSTAGLTGPVPRGQGPRQGPEPKDQWEYNNYILMIRYFQSLDEKIDTFCYIIIDNSFVTISASEMDNNEA